MVLAAASLFLVASMASAASIGMNFVDGTVDNRGSGGGGVLAPGDVAGEPSVAQANWNNASPDGAANNGALTGLVDSFVTAVGGGDTHQIPEPSALLLVLVALGVIGGRGSGAGERNGGAEHAHQCRRPLRTPRRPVCGRSV